MLPPTDVVPIIYKGTMFLRCPTFPARVTHGGDMYRTFLFYSRSQAPIKIDAGRSGTPT
jgi:hypothetical protein